MTLAEPLFPSTSYRSFCGRYFTSEVFVYMTVTSLEDVSSGCYSLCFNELHRLWTSSTHRVLFQRTLRICRRLSYGICEYKWAWMMPTLRVHRGTMPAFSRG